MTPCLHRRYRASWAKHIWPSSSLSPTARENPSKAQSSIDRVRQAGEAARYIGGGGSAGVSPASARKLAGAVKIIIGPASGKYASTNGIAC